MFQEAIRSAAWLKSLGLLVLLGALVLGIPRPASAGLMHARSVIGLGVCGQFAPEGGVAHCERHQGSKYRVSHEEFGNNYTYGNAGNGHAHHHSGLLRTQEGGEQQSSDRQRPGATPPLPGSKGTSQYIKQTWLPNPAGGKIDVAWTPDSFLQVDPTELHPGTRIVNRATLTAPGGVTGTVELSARLDRKGKPQLDKNLSGIFKDLKIELVTHPNGVVSLRFPQAPKWTLPGKAETFDIALDASIDVGSPRLVDRNPASPHP